MTHLPHKMIKGVLNVCCSFYTLNKALNDIFFVFASIVVGLYVLFVKQSTYSIIHSRVLISCTCRFY